MLVLCLLFKNQYVKHRIFFKLLVAGIYCTHKYLEFFSQHENEILIKIVHLFPNTCHTLEFSLFYLYLFNLLLFSVTYFPFWSSILTLTHSQNLVFLFSQRAFIPRSQVFILCLLFPIGSGFIDCILSFYSAIWTDSKKIIIIIPSTHSKS